MKWLLRLAVLIAGSMGGAAALRRWLAMMQAQVRDDALRQAAEERSRFLQRLDHELKNPLTAIRIGLANLSDTDDPAARQQIRANMQAQVLRLGHLVADLRKLADLETGRLERGAVPIGEMLEEVLLGIQDEGHERRLIFPTQYDSFPDIMGDRDLLQLAVYNLLDNALKFTQPGDMIALRVTVTDADVVIEVRDTGRGIPQADLPHVWEELYRSREVHGIPGSGIGLAMVRAIIERHDGEVNLESTVGQGTVVTLTLPLDQ